MHPIEALQINPFVLAPMAGITDHSFRTFMKELGAGVVVTELISSTGIEYKNDKTLKLMSFDETQRPVGIQLFGESPEGLGNAAKVCEEKGCDFIDLNFGCPVPKVVKKGAGSAILKDLDRLTEVLSTVKKSVNIPVTIKIRTGWDHPTRNAHEVCNIAYNEGISWVAIHGRTRAQGYSGLADWDYIADVKANSKIPIIGNGDIHSAEQANQRLKDSGCDGVMIGRGCLKNPYIFADAFALYRGDRPQVSGRSYSTIFNKLHQTLIQYCDDYITSIQLRKFAAWYASGCEGAAQFRKNIFQAKQIEEIIFIANDFFDRIDLQQRQDTSQEAFLMGGHG